MMKGINKSTGLYEVKVRGIEIMQTSNVPALKSLLTEVESDLKASPKNTQLLEEQRLVQGQLDDWAQWSRVS